MLSNVFMVKLPQLFLVLSHLPDPTAQFQHPIVCESHSLEYHSILFVMKLFYILFPTVSFIFTGTKLFSMKLYVSYCKTLSDFVTSHMNQTKNVDKLLRVHSMDWKYAPLTSGPSSWKAD